MQEQILDNYESAHLWDGTVGIGARITVGNPAGLSSGSFGFSLTTSGHSDTISANFRSENPTGFSGGALGFKLLTVEVESPALSLKPNDPPDKPTSLRDFRRQLLRQS